MFQAKLFCFSAYLGVVRGGGGVCPNGLVHYLLMRFFTLGGSKVEVSEAYFFDIVTIQNDHPTYTAFLGQYLCVFHDILGNGSRGGGVSPRIGTRCNYVVFYPGLLEHYIKKNDFKKLHLWICVG